MLAFDREGSGAPLVLLHGTNSSRSIWKPLLPQLSDQREVLSVDLPAHGQSPPSSFTPPDWAKEVAALLDHLGLEHVAVVGHSSGGWAALELAKLGRASGVLALTPAGLWKKHSPPITDAILAVNWRLAQILGETVVTKPLHTRMGRRMSLRQISAQPADVPAEGVIAMVKTVFASKHFPDTSGKPPTATPQPSADPTRRPDLVVWGNNDRIAASEHHATPTSSQSTRPRNTGDLHRSSGRHNESSDAALTLPTLGVPETVSVSTWLNRPLTSWVVHAGIKRQKTKPSRSTTSPVTRDRLGKDRAGMDKGVGIASHRRGQRSQAGPRRTAVVRPACEGGVECCGRDKRSSPETGGDGSRARMPCRVPRAEEAMSSFAASRSSR